MALGKILKNNRVSLTLRNIVHFFFPIPVKCPVLLLFLGTKLAVRVEKKEKEKSLVSPLYKSNTIYTFCFHSASHLICPPSFLFFLVNLSICQTVHSFMETEVAKSHLKTTQASSSFSIHANYKPFPSDNIFITQPRE